MSCQFIVGEWLLELLFHSHWLKRNTTIGKLWLKPNILIGWNHVQQCSSALCTCCLISIDIITVKKKKKKHPVRCHSCTYIFKTQHLWHWQNNKSRPWHSTGNAGFRLHFPAHFELVGDQEARRQDSGGEQSGMEQLPRPQPVARSVEACIGQKLQLIGDQFHREHLQLVRRKCASSQTLWPLVWW